MSEISKKVDEQIRNGKINFNAKPPQEKKKGIFGKIVTWPFRMFAAMFGLEGVTKDSYVGSRGGHHHHHSPSPRGFRESNRVSGSGYDPYTYDPIKMANLKHYLGGIDGKGDPHDCDHEH